ncbi:type II secretion system protein GspM [Diaphorobacter sp.]|uniref:type II secretion system protein GspM n=1 Tax=Diaphorobacter sp. TaxID=1934310 RepID=UPI002589B71C|nr:type II secretion system protein GspM [Diaphorobacter sp.]
MNRQALRRGAIVALTIAIVLLPLLWGGMYVWQKHTWVRDNLARIEPRHARLLGLEAQGSDLTGMLERAQAMRAQYVYPATQDDAQTGNLAQQKLRGIFASAGLQVISSQALPTKESKGFDRIPLSVRAEGDMLAVQSALAVLSSQQPAIFLNELNIQLVGGLNQANTRVTPKLAVQFNFSVLRERT